MTSKTVAGQSGKYYAQRAFDAAIEKGYGPEYVELWREWFNSTQSDAELAAAQNATKPKPEYYATDLESVATKALDEVIESLKHYGYTGSLSVVRDVRRALQQPGCVIGLVEK